MRAGGQECPPHTNPLRILDVGTGSGCIALALAKEFPDAEIHATDISAVALEIARANAARHQFEKRIHFHQADLLEGLNLTDFDFIVSNPPYVGESEEDQVQLEVRKYRAARRRVCRTYRSRGHCTSDPAGPRSSASRRMAHPGNQRNDCWEGRATPRFLGRRSHHSRSAVHPTRCAGAEAAGLIAQGNPSAIAHCELSFHQEFGATSRPPQLFLFQVFVSRLLGPRPTPSVAPPPAEFPRHQ